jgi:hypothetical protein
VPLRAALRASLGRRSLRFAQLALHTRGPRVAAAGRRIQRIISSAALRGRSRPPRKRLRIVVITVIVIVRRFLVVVAVFGARGFFLLTLLALLVLLLAFIPLGIIPLGIVAPLGIVTPFSIRVPGDLTRTALQRRRRRAAAALQRRQQRIIGAAVPCAQPRLGRGTQAESGGEKRRAGRRAPCAFS